jgi:hypothetical protein
VKWFGSMVLAMSVSALAVPALAAEPPAAPAPLAVAEAPKATGPAADKAAAPRRPLDLRIGDIRKYMPPEEYRALMNIADERNTVLVQADAPLLTMKHEKPVPVAIMAPFWALANPTQAWRILVPDLNRPHSGPPESKVPPPVFRWGP